MPVAPTQQQVDALSHEVDWLLRTTAILWLIFLLFLTSPKLTQIVAPPSAMGFFLILAAIFSIITFITLGEFNRAWRQWLYHSNNP